MTDKNFPYNQEFPNHPYVWCITGEQEVCTHSNCQKWWEEMWCPCGEKLSRQGQSFDCPNEHLWAASKIWKDPNRFTKPDDDEYDREKILEALRNLTNKDVRAIEIRDNPKIFRQDAAPGTIEKLRDGDIWVPPNGTVRKWDAKFGWQIINHDGIVPDHLDPKKITAGTIQAGDKKSLRIGEYVQMGKDGYLEPWTGGPEPPLGILESVRVEQETIEVTRFGDRKPRYMPGPTEVFGDVRVESGETAEFPIHTDQLIENNSVTAPPPPPPPPRKTKIAGESRIPSVYKRMNNPPLTTDGNVRAMYEAQIRPIESFKIPPTSFS